MISTVRGVTTAEPRPNGGCGSRTASWRSLHAPARRRHQGHALAQAQHAGAAEFGLLTVGAGQVEHRAAAGEPPPLGGGYRDPAPEAAARNAVDQGAVGGAGGKHAFPDALHLPPRAGGRVAVQGGDGGRAAGQRGPRAHDRVVGAGDVARLRRRHLVAALGAALGNRRRGGAGQGDA